MLTRRDEIVAPDLAGDEARWPARLFAEHFRRAREAGLRVTVHAGEAAGPESVWEAIRELGADRIGHATSAVQDPRLMDFMAERRTGIEANLTSIVLTNAAPSYERRPLRPFLEHGLLATTNTDNPTTSGITLAHEYEAAAPAAGFDEKLIR